VTFAATFNIHPKELADILANAVDIGKDKTTRPLICLAASGDTLHAYGRGQFTAGRDYRRFKTETPQFGALVITEDEATELATTLRGLEGAGRKETTVFVYLLERDRLRVESGEDTLCDLPDADTNQETFGMPDELSDWEEIDELLMDIAKGPSPALQRFGFQKDVLARMNKIRADSPVMDIALHPTGHAVGIALGSTFRALIAGIDRQSFATGGKWGDGPGKPDMLWEA
jgi:hypothetical protein